jgi:flagellum-specific peptidoglycan hydrolase FlgJ
MTMTKQEFIKKLELTFQEAQKRGANINKAVCFAQAAHESNWGNSTGAIKGNNLFGIKATKSWKGRVINLKGFEEVAGKNQYSPINWRAYDSWTDCIYNYSQIINLTSWYKDALPYITDDPNRCDADLFLKNIIAEPPSAMFPHGEPGWATDSKYFDKVKRIGKEIESIGGLKWT